MHIDDIQILENTRLTLATSEAMSTDLIVRSVLPDLQLMKEAGGKPYFRHSNESIVPCSLTHTQGFSAVCWGTSGQIGIDAERADRLVHAGLAARMRHPEDDPELYALPILAWIIKESVLKCIGTGLRLGMNKISVRLIDPERFIAQWNGQTFHGILMSRHDIRLSIAYSPSPQ